jgi:hypothetical protein
MQLCWQPIVDCLSQDLYWKPHPRSNYFSTCENVKKQFDFDFDYDTTM